MPKKVSNRPDEAHRRTDAELAGLEQRITEIYREARNSLDAAIREYFAKLETRDAKMKQLIGTVLNGREWTEQDYKLWRLNQIARGKRFEALRDKMAERYTEANETAVAYINDATPGIYSLNRNYSAYTIDKATGGALTVGPDGETLNADFILFDEQTVKRLIVEQPDVMPYYPPKRAVRRGIDLRYGKSQITKQVTSGALQGLGVGKIADALQERMETMSRTSALRAARTGVTAAQNAGRMDSYHAAETMGIRLRKRWLATLDGRTRHEHQILDGQTQDVDAPFVVEGQKIRYPGDPDAAPHLVYNCRCTLVTALPQNLSAGQRRARDPVTGESVVIPSMTYTEWQEWLQTGKVPDYSATDRFHKKGDPIYDALGPIEKSHPQEMLRIIAEAKSLGVEVIEKPGNMAYAPGLSRGQTGQLHINLSDSYGAWLHEEQHMLDDKNDGWGGFAGLMDVDRRSRMEYNAYRKEVALAKSLDRNDLVDELRRLCHAELETFGGEWDESKLS